MRRLLTLFLTIAVLLPAVPRPAARAQTDDDNQIAALLDTMTPTERIGQLMLVTFEGTYLGPETPIVQLIHDYNIGGVMLLAENDNINGPVNTPRLVQSLTTDLQQVAYNAAQPGDDRPDPRAFVPLFIATRHPGDGQPQTQIAQGTTPLPSSMALGATWNPEYARQVGQIAGVELSAMGINMLFGPALDVLQQPQAERALDLGVNTFGGDPFWVGQMGQAYVTGVHEGSQQRIAVIAQNFPGLGFADTQPAQEIPVVPRSVEELSRIDLVPYYAVTGQAGNTLARVEGIQCANIRYQGENIRTNTRPICIDEQAADQLLQLKYFEDWRTTGLMISSPLGTPAIRRYYNISPFPHRQVARAAFLAGNDILYLAEFGPKSGADQVENVIDVIEFFAELYENDPVFRRKVDEALARVLRVKLALYEGDFTLDNIATAPLDIQQTGKASAGLYAIAQESVTLIAPRRENLPPPPGRDDNIVIFTDVRLVQQCSYCAAYPLVSFNELESAIELRYGPYGGSQIRPEQVTSFSFNQLQSYLRGSIEGLSADDNQFKTNQRIGEALRGVDWIVLVMLDVSSTVEASDVVHFFLNTQTGLMDRAHVAVITLGAPTYLSSTEISKLSAYIGVYSHTAPYIDAAARALFQELSYAGDLPISLPAVGYNLAEATTPDPSQTIQLEIFTLDDQSIPEPVRTTNLLTLGIGEQLILRTAPLLDHNGHVVPDGTPVEFTLTFITDTEDLRTRQTSTTQQGRAYTSFTPNRTGRVEIRATSLEAAQSEPFQIVVVEDVTDRSRFADAVPDNAPTDSDPPASPAAVVLIPPISDDDSDAGPGTTPGNSPDGSATPDDTGRVNLGDFMLAVFGLLLLGGLGFSVGVSTTFSVDGGIRVLLGCVVAGLIGYIYYGLGGPGTTEIKQRLDDMSAVITTLGTGLVGLIYAWWALWKTRWQAS
jgi:beta-N-acetylhexosaminidase